MLPKVVSHVIHLHLCSRTVILNSTGKITPTHKTVTLHHCMSRMTRHDPEWLH